MTKYTTARVQHISRSADLGRFSTHLVGQTQLTQHVAQACSLDNRFPRRVGQRMATGTHKTVGARRSRPPGTVASLAEGGGSTGWRGGLPTSTPPSLPQLSRDPLRWRCLGIDGGWNGTRGIILYAPMFLWITLQGGIS